MMWRVGHQLQEAIRVVSLSFLDLMVQLINWRLAIFIQQAVFISGFFG